MPKQKSTDRKNKWGHFVLSNHSWAWSLPWRVVDTPSGPLGWNWCSSFQQVPTANTFLVRGGTLCLLSLLGARILSCLSLFRFCACSHSICVSILLCLEVTVVLFCSSNILIWIKWPLVICFYMHRSAPHSAITTEASCSRWGTIADGELSQRP